MKTLEFKLQQMLSIFISQAFGVMIIDVGNEIGNPSSKAGRSCLRFISR